MHPGILVVVQLRGRPASAYCLNSVTWFGNEKGMFLAFIFGIAAGQQNPRSRSVSLVLLAALLGCPRPPPLPPHQGTWHLVFLSGTCSYETKLCP